MAATYTFSGDPKTLLGGDDFEQIRAYLTCDQDTLTDPDTGEVRVFGEVDLILKDATTTAFSVELPGNGWTPSPHFYTLHIEGRNRQSTMKNRIVTTQPFQMTADITLAELPQAAPKAITVEDYESLIGARDEALGAEAGAVTAKEAAEAAAAEATAIVIADADEVVATAIETPGTATATALQASTESTIQEVSVARWAPSTAYIISDQVISPGGDIVSANTNHTSGVSYDATKWNTSITFANNRDALASSAAPVTRPQETLITRFDSGHGWTAVGSGWASSDLADATDGVWGSRCVSGVTTTGAAGAAFQGQNLLSGFDPASKVVAIMVKIADVTAIGQIECYISSETTIGSNTRQINFTSDVSRVADNNQPVLLLADLADAAANNGTGPGSSIKSMRITFRGVAGKSTTVKLCGVSYYTKPSVFPKGVACLTFDDSYASQKTFALPEMNKRRFRGTLFPVVAWLGSGASFYTLADLYNWRDYHGWEVGAHAYTDHTAFTSLTADQLELELQYIKRWLTTNGFRSETIANPGGLSNQAIRDASARYFRYARLTTNGDEPIPPADPLRLRSFTVGPGVSLASATNYLDRAYAAGMVATFTFHDIVNSGGSAFAWSEANFTGLLDAIAAKGDMPVLPLGDALIKLAAA